MSPKWDSLLITDAKHLLQLGFYRIKLWCNLDSRSPGLRLDWNHFEVQSWHSIMPGLFNARRHMGSQPTLEGSPRPSFIVIITIIVIIIQLGEYITHIRLSNRRLEQITAFMWALAIVCDGRSKTLALLFREVQFFIKELCSGAVVYTRSSCVYSQGLFQLGKAIAFLKNSRGWTYQPTSEMNAASWLERCMQAVQREYK